MAYFKFTKKIFEGKPIDIYNYGKMQRDFTDIDDIVD
jgi:UDP-glucuronate 4-epimerase